jgi:hypothetical protein
MKTLRKGMDMLFLKRLGEKGKGKVTLRGLSALRPLGPIVFLPQQVPAFISRGATHHTDVRDLYQRRREILLMNFASKSGIYEIH